ncbi:MAG: hypothetical protein N2246_07640, partial [Candidatus Sumerlaeia bacterium]|nr:hypothetical protein [Candidatus Sumerlaeia bacterium]
LISIFFHLAIFSFLFSHSILPVKDESQFNRVTLVLKPIQPPAEMPPEITPPSAPPLPSVATSPEPQQSETKETDLVSVSEKHSPDKEQSLEQEAKEQLNIERRKLLTELSELQSQKENLRLKLEVASQLAQAKTGKYLSAGAPKGAVRTLNFKGQPQKIVDEIMRRYDITIQQKFVGPASRTSFLSYAETEGGVYVNHPGSGFYEVFVLSRKAMAKMSQLEAQEIIKRGYDIERTTVIRAEFGIVAQNDGYDLGILALELQEIK